MWRSLNKQTQKLATQLYRKQSGQDRFEHFVIYQNGFRHVHPADLIALKNGELLLMAREGTEHISNDGDVIMLRSKDQGRTWGEKQTIGSIKNLDEREGCGIQLKDGTILVGDLLQQSLRRRRPLQVRSKGKRSGPMRPTNDAVWERTSSRRATTDTPGPNRTTSTPPGCRLPTWKGRPMRRFELPDGSVVDGSYCVRIERRRA